MNGEQDTERPILCAATLHVHNYRTPIRTAYSIQCTVNGEQDTERANGLIRRAASQTPHLVRRSSFQTNAPQGTVTVTQETLSCAFDRENTCLDTSTQSPSDRGIAPARDRNKKHHLRIPKPLLSLVRLPSSHDGLELRQPPCLFHEGRLHRGIQIHQLKAKDHVEFLVLWKDVRSERRGIVCKGRLAYRDQVMACGNPIEREV